MNENSTFYLCVLLALGGCVAADPSQEIAEPDTGHTEQALGFIWSYTNRNERGIRQDSEIQGVVS